MCTEGYRWHRGDAGATGGVRVVPGAAAARGGALQYCDSVTRGPHAPSPTRAGDTDTAVEGGSPPRVPHVWLPHAGTSTPRPHQASPEPSAPIPSPPTPLPNIILQGN